ncbi:MAG: CpaD family pilus assembly lipoprotein [Stellaceae bacterium]
MRTHLYPIVMALLPVLTGCVPGVAEYSKSEAPAQLRIDGATTSLAVAFAPGSARLGRAEAARLNRLVATGGIAPADRVAIAAAGPPGLAAARDAAISRALLRWGIVADSATLAAVPRDQAIVTVGRYAVTLPPCPNWSMRDAGDFTNAPASDFGCATAINLGLMVASPADLVGGRTLAAADGKPAAQAVDDYLAGKVQLPAGTSLGPIATGGGGSSSGSGGAASGGGGGQ